MTFSNPLFDVNDDFTSSNNESLPEEDVQEENFKIYSNLLFEFDEEYISSDINPLYNEVLKDIDCENSLLAIDEPFLLDTPPPSSKLVSLEELNKDEYFDPGGGEIDAGIPPNFKDGYYNSKGDIIYLESLLINDNIPYLPPEVFLDHDPKSLNDEPNIDDLKIKKNVRITFEDRHYLFLTFVIKIFLPFLTYPVNSLLLFSSGSKDTIFDPGISAYSFYSLEPVAYESPMTFFHSSVSVSRTKEFGVSQARDSHKNKRFSGGNPCFYLLFSNRYDVRRLAFFLSRVLWFVFYVQDCPDYEDSRAHGFVHRSLKLQS
ncbi:hypothetical protein Tco_0956407 [Tanacetum coccineum]